MGVCFPRNLPEELSGSLLLAATIMSRFSAIDMGVNSSLSNKSWFTRNKPRILALVKRGKPPLRGLKCGDLHSLA